MIRKIRCYIICYWLNLFLALDTLACQLIHNGYPQTLSSRDYTTDNSILGIGGEEMAMLDRFLDWLGVKISDPDDAYILEVKNHYEKWFLLETVDRHYFRTNGREIYYGEC